QFALGAFLALAAIPRAGRLKDLSGAGAVLALVALGIIANGETSNLIINALLPALAATLFIWSSEAPLMRRIFGSAPFLWVGKRSNSIYLTHWPIMVLWPIAKGSALGIPEAFLAIAISIVTGALLHSLVEQRYRVSSAVTPHRLGIRTLGTLGFCLAVVTAGAHLWGYYGGSPRGTTTTEIMVDTQEIIQERGVIFSKFACEVWKDIDPAEFKHDRCTKKHPTKPTVLVIGDSTATEVRAIFSMAYPDVHFAQLSVSGCRIDLKDMGKNSRRPWCHKFVELALSTAQNGKYDDLVFASVWKADQPDAANNLITWANNLGYRPVIVLGRVKFDERVSEIIAGADSHEEATRRALSRIDQTSLAFDRELISNLEGRYKLLNMRNFQCESSGCPIFDTGNRLIYLDQVHLSASGMTRLALQLATRRANLFDNLR
ncbi:MAG: SGNH hydrolase domain-containing protein, partial [Pseudomonadota bacterium]